MELPEIKRAQSKDIGVNGYDVLEIDSKTVGINAEVYLEEDIELERNSRAERDKLIIAEIDRLVVLFKLGSCFDEIMNRLKEDAKVDERG